MVYPELARTILEGYKLPTWGVHGVGHWARVYENGARLAALNGARLEVVELFALFHDARRWNEEFDPLHGARGARLAADLRGRAFDLAEEDFNRLVEACRGHTSGRVGTDLTVQTCLDADRLDLERVGIIVNPRRLSTTAAREPGVIRWASERARQEHLARDTLARWGLTAPD